MNEVLKIWQERLLFLQTEEATAVGPDAKFAIRKAIQEAEAKVEKHKNADLPPKLPPHVDGIERYAPTDLVGRDQELKLLNKAWTAPQTNVQTIVAIGGEGKTSLVARWVANLAARGWPDCDAAFAWSFYSQGSQEQSAASPEVFFERALAYFSDGAPPPGPLSAYDRGDRLARLVTARPSLLILDGLEPLQHPPSSPLAGELKDPGLSVLLKRLATHNPGLCVVTTRHSVADLRNYRRTTAPEHELSQLSPEAGTALLKSFALNGPTSEFKELIETVKGHALTLTLLGGYLKRAHRGDIRRWREVEFDRADEKTLGGHAFRTIAAYERWLLEDDGEEGKREVALLRLMGLFDRPADAGCLKALREAKPKTSNASPNRREEETPVATTLSPGGRGKGEGVGGGDGRTEEEALDDLVEPLRDLDEEDWEYLLTGLESAKLLTVNQERGEMVCLDAHPLLREYFARELKLKHPQAWREAHGRLFDHLCGSVEHRPDTLGGLQPLYQAISHGCRAERHMEACAGVFRDRIQREDEFYSTRNLGAFGSDLDANACFFDPPWRRVTAALPPLVQGWLLNDAAFCLRTLGRSGEAKEPMREGLRRYVELEVWQHAAVSASNLSELELSLGATEAAVETAKQSVEHADRSNDAFLRMANRTTLADALHQSGQRQEAQTLFQEAERMQKERQPGTSLLYSVQGFQYCDLRLAEVERAAWKQTLDPTSTPTEGFTSSCAEVEDRAERALQIAERNNWLLSLALDHLTLAQVSLYRFLIGLNQDEGLDGVLDRAVDGLRRANSRNHLPQGLLPRAWCHALFHRYEQAKLDLNEAWEIAESGPMLPFTIDVLLHRARLFYKETPYPWEGSAQADLSEARRLIEKHGYGRRKEELEDAESIIL